ncbi:LGFP repeat-containing protein [Modestobacter italicus]|uniref:LGFP repeat-containing protein n=1 Tax=Modestobacter italicus (strain DSM 44449 / CECT 9708 / BC 501) TaxID=2732864 RepID=UPI001FEC44B3|nr:hypothetical protein [Modestobacter italicus]
MRMLTRVLVIASVVAAALVAPTSGVAPTNSAGAADLRYFDPSNIISDAVFYDSWSMDGPAIQAFLNAKGAKCSAGEMPCIKDYKQDTAAMAADSLCAGYAAGNGESAATIIAKVAVSCGISPRVLLVLLQKEQSLITRTAPTVYAYTHATGFGCPDTAPCNPTFSGFVSQVYFAARQFQNYRKNAQNFGKRVGRTSTISYYPATSAANNLNDSRCGNAQVYMSNAATAGLYNYTPYLPNQAALNAGYGTGDACSSYGNRNFWNYFTDWFGSTQSTGGGAIMTKYQSMGGESGALGPATTSFYCGLVGGGCWQAFQAGRIYWSPATGANAVMGEQGERFLQLGSENGLLGYPVSDNVCGLPQGGCYQQFQNATLYGTPATGTRIVRGDIRAAFRAQGSEWGPLGYPTTDEVYGLPGDGVYQQFQNGRVYWSPSTGAHPVVGDQLARHEAQGGPAGLGYPSSDLTCGLIQSGCYQVFTGGNIYTTPTSGTFAVRGGMLTAFRAQGSEWGALGYPTADEAYGSAEGGSSQRFQNGTLYWSPATDAHAVIGDQLATYVAQGAEAGPLGYPRSELICGLIHSGCYQLFTGGTVYRTDATGTHAVRGGMLTLFKAQGSEWGELGFPTTDEVYGLPGGGSYQEFQNGRTYWSPASGAHAVTGRLLTYWQQLGGESSAAGYPAGAAKVSGTVSTQQFTGGRISYDTATSSGTFTPR